MPELTIPKSITSEEGRAIAQQVLDLHKSITDELAKTLGERDVDLLGKLDKQLTDQLKIAREQWDSEHPNHTVPGVSEELEKQPFQLGAFVKGIYHGDFDRAGAGRELEISRACIKQFQVGLSRKAAVTYNDETLAGMVPTEVSDKIIEKFRPAVVAHRLGVKEEQRSGNPYTYWIESGYISPDWNAEGHEAKESEPSITPAESRPHNCDVIMKLTDDLLEDASDVEGFVRRQLNREFPIKIDGAFFNGNGQGSNPFGFTQTGGIDASVDLTGGVTYNNLGAIIHVLRLAESLDPRCKWAMHPDVLKAIEEMTDASGQPLERRQLASGPITTLRGYQFETTTHMPATGPSIGFGNFEQDAAISAWGPLTFAKTEAFLFNKFTTVVRARLRRDVIFYRPESFTIGQNFGS